MDWINFTSCCRSFFVVNDQWLLVVTCNIQWVIILTTLFTPQLIYFLSYWSDSLFFKLEFLIDVLFDSFQSRAATILIISFWITNIKNQISKGSILIYGWFRVPIYFGEFLKEQTIFLRKPIFFLVSTPSIYLGKWGSKTRYHIFVRNSEHTALLNKHHGLQTDLIKVKDSSLIRTKNM